MPKHNSALHLSSYDATPEAAIAAIENHRGPLLVDLDETLYLRNSTEDFIDCAHPRLPALLLLRLLDAIKPWRWTGGDTTRDVWRVRLISFCFPWISRLWRTRVTRLAADFGNRRLLAAIAKSSVRPVITTIGFQPIVTPLVAALGLSQAQIVAARLNTFADRRTGKLSLVQNALGKDIVHRATVLTDSDQDRPLLNACAQPLCTLWPEARFRSALSDVYLPGQYLSQVKRPGTRYITRGILQEDFAFWVLSSVALAALPIFHVAGLLFLCLSFWAIYERGYVDNDLIAARFEDQPKLSAAFLRTPVATPRWQPWIWSSASAAIALVLLRWPRNPIPLDAAKWAAVLLATHGWFWLYNRIDKQSRVWMFGGLQFARSMAFVALVPITMVGALALAAHTLGKWMLYYFYRLSNNNWPQVPFHLIRLFFFVVLAVALGFTQGFSYLFNLTAFALLGWNLFRARQELWLAFNSCKRLDRVDHKQAANTKPVSILEPEPELEHE